MPISPDINQVLQQFFDRIFVVSVPRFTERHEKLKKNLEGLSFDFFWGADKNALTIEQANEDGLYNKPLAEKLSPNGRGLNVGEIACSLSHRMIYEETIKNNWQKVLILEDDVWPVYEQLPVIAEMLKELPPDWELVYFGYIKNESPGPGAKLKRFFYQLTGALGLTRLNYTMAGNMLPRAYSRHLKKAGFHDCTHAYAISLNGAQQLLKEQTPVVHRADDLLSTTIMQGKLKAFITEPKFFDQEDFHNKGAASEVRE